MHTAISLAQVMPHSVNVSESMHQLKGPSYTEWLFGQRKDVVRHQVLLVKALL